MVYKTNEIFWEATHLKQVFHATHMPGIYYPGTSRHAVWWCEISQNTQTGDVKLDYRPVIDATLDKVEVDWVAPKVRSY